MADKGLVYFRCDYFYMEQVLSLLDFNGDYRVDERQELKKIIVKWCEFREDVVSVGMWPRDYGLLRELIVDMQYHLALSHSDIELPSEDAPFERVERIRVEHEQMLNDYYAEKAEKKKAYTEWLEGRIEELLREDPKRTGASIADALHIGRPAVYAVWKPIRAKVLAELEDEAQAEDTDDRASGNAGDNGNGVVE